MGGCGCGSPGCGGPPCTTLPRSVAFTVQTPETYAHSLARRLIKPADRLRNLFTRFGMRPYIVRWVRTRWSGGAKGMGQEAVIGDPEIILPTPLVLDLASLQEVVTPIGTSEDGGVMLTEVSGCYTEEQLRGLSNDRGAPTPADESFYYEIEFLRADGVPGEQRRFQVAGTPEYIADQFMWHVKLERARPDRQRFSGAPR